LYFLGTILGSYLEIFSQDVHFSMFYRTPLLLNPANTGNFDGLWRLNTTYRKQGDIQTNPYSTNVLTFDMPVYYFKRIGSIGISILNDRTANKTLNTNEFNISTAHFLKISKYSYLHLGFSFALVNKSISYDDLTFPEQFDNSIGAFNPNLDNKEQFDKFSLTYLDLSWGAIWSRFSKNIDSQIGVAMFHYNSPKIKFMPDNDKILPKYQFHAYFNKKISQNLLLKPKFLFTYTNKANEMLTGSEISMIFNENLKNLYAGAYIRTGIDRNTDAIIFITGLTYNNFIFNFSYDYPVNSTFLAKDLTFEISIFYKMPKLNPLKKSIQCEIL